mgnify:CR=1 FL=1
MRSIIITDRLKEMINGFLGAEMIPECAIGSELTYLDGDLIVKTFQAGKTTGYRKLTSAGELVNIIAELG